MYSRLQHNLRRGLSIFTRPSEGTNSQWARPRSVQDVVVCVGSNVDRSAKAVQAACDIAHRSSNDRVSVRAIHVPRTRDWRADARVATILQSVQGSNASVEIVSHDDHHHLSTKKSIIKELDAHQADLCVIAAGRESSHWPRLFSTVQYVANHSPCDVLIVRQDGLDALSADHPMKALVCFGINDWEGSIDAFRATLRIARPGDTIEAVHVVYPGRAIDGLYGPPMSVPSGDGTPESKISKALEGAMIKALEDESTALTRKDVNIAPVVIQAGFDNPMKTLVEYASSSGANLISVGVGCIGRIFAPVNFSYYIAHHSPCSVLVAKRTADTSNTQTTDSTSFYVEDPREWLRHKSFI